MAAPPSVGVSPPRKGGIVRNAAGPDYGGTALPSPPLDRTSSGLASTPAGYLLPRPQFARETSVILTYRGTICLGPIHYLFALLDLPRPPDGSYVDQRRVVERP